jgi:hypothetical protein
MPSVAVRVHHSVSTHPFRRPGSRCPAVRCPARPVSGHLAPSSGSGCPAVWCPARPASSCLVSVRSPYCIHLVPVSGWWRWGHVGTAGNRHDCNEASSMWSGPSPSGSVDGPSRPGCGQRCGGRVEASGGASAADLGRVVLGRGGCGRPIREARPPQGPPRGWRLRQAGGLAEARRFRTYRVAAILAEARLLSVAVVEPDARVDGLRRANELTARMGTRPQRGPDVQGVLQARRCQRFDLREWWWARQGLNL